MIPEIFLAGAGTAKAPYREKNNVMKKKIPMSTKISNRTHLWLAT
jgi:hypothetical protein